MLWVTWAESKSIHCPFKTFSILGCSCWRFWSYKGVTGQCCHRSFSCCGCNCWTCPWTWYICQFHIFKSSSPLPYVHVYYSGGSEEPKPREPTLGTPLPLDSNITTTLPTPSPPAGSQNSTEAPGTDDGISPGGGTRPQEATTTATASPTATETPTGSPITGDTPRTTTLSTTTTTRNATG